MSVDEYRIAQLYMIQVREPCELRGLGSAAQADVKLHRGAVQNVSETVMTFMLFKSDLCFRFVQELRHSMDSFLTI